MRPLPSLQRLTRWAIFIALGSLTLAVASAEEAEKEKRSKWNLSDFIDGLPDVLSERLPGFDHDPSLRFYVRPHLGDFLHRDYLRTPIGVRVRSNENVESNVEVETYFTHGLGDSAGYGLSTLRVGSRYDHAFPQLNEGAGVSVGFNYRTPLSRPPFDLTDGYRHLEPYVSATRPFMPQWPLLGFATVSADIIDRTPNRPNFGENQLHSNSLMFLAGAAHEFPRFRGTLTFSLNTSSLISDENKNVYAIRPEVVIPWKMHRDATTQIFVTLGARSIWGPDGNDIGVNSSVRFEFQFKRRNNTR